MTCELFNKWDAIWMRTRRAVSSLLLFYLLNIGHTFVIVVLILETRNNIKL